MQNPLQITMRHVDDLDTADLRQTIEDQAGKLDQQVDRITSCHVTVEGPSPHHKQGGEWEIKAELHLFRGEVLIQKERGPVAGDAVQAAFKSLRRRAHEAIDKMSG